MKVKELEKKYHIGNQTICKWVKNGKLPIQPNWIKGQPYDINEEDFLKIKKYYWNDRARVTYATGWNRDIFQVIDTPEKAYWLGFILADGCLHLTKPGSFQGHLSIDISGEDIQHLEKFASFIEAQEDVIQHTKHSITGNDLVHVQLCCTATLKDLYNLGIRPKKSGQEQWINTLFPADFIRGCYDGDGYIKHDLHSIGLVGSYSLLSSIQAHFYEILNIPPHKIGEHGTIWRIEYASKLDKQKIANYLWYDGCVSLDRKQKLADQIKKIC